MKELLLHYLWIFFKKIKLNKGFKQHILLWIGLSFFSTITVAQSFTATDFLSFKNENHLTSTVSWSKNSLTSSIAEKGDIIHQQKEKTVLTSPIKSSIYQPLTTFNVDFNTSGVCANETEWLVPIDVGVITSSIGAISLVIDYDTSIMVYDTVHSAATGINILNIIATDNNGKISISWANTSGATVSNTTMMTLRFIPKGTATDFSASAASTVAFNWDQSTPENCQLSDNLGGILDAIFNNKTNTTVYSMPTLTFSNSTTNNAICVGDNVTFTAVPTTIGSFSYEFFINNVSQGTASSTNTFSTTNLNDQDVISVMMTDGNGCSVSDEVVFTVVTSLLTPTLVSSDTDNIICAEEEVTFTAIPTATGSFFYEFFINNISQGTPTTSADFTTRTLADGDIVTVEATNIGGCSGVSSGIITSVNSLPTIGLTSDATANAICPSENVIFTGTGGLSYEFFVNGSSQGTPNSNTTFVTNTLVNGDSIEVIGRDNNACSDTALIQMTVNPLPNIGLTVVNDTICNGDNTIFTANGGASYEFFINNISQGNSSTNTTFSSNTLADGDNINVIGIDANTCINTSNNIIMTVNSLPSTVLTSDDSDSRVCQGQVVTFDASGTDSYIFYLNNIQQNTLPTYIHTSNNDGDVISVLGIDTLTGCSQLANTTFTLDVDSCFDVFGQLLYKNAPQTSMGNVFITVTGPGVNKTVVTDIVDGHFAIPDLFNNETYNFSYATTKSHGGINITDALLVLFETVGLNFLAGLNEQAGDVNGSGILTATDAFFIYYRHIFPTIIDTFPAGDWIFEEGEVTPNGADILGLKLFALAMGDVNASYTPNPAENGIPKVNLVENGQTPINEGERILIPITIEQAASINGMSLSMYFPSDAMTVHDVIFGNDTSVLFNPYDNELRVGWLSLESRTLTQNEVLLYIDATIHDLNAYQSAPIGVNTSSEFADYNAAILSQVNLSIPSFYEVTTSTNEIEMNTVNVRSFPNPFSHQVTFEYDLSTASEVQIELFNSLGQSIHILKNGHQSKGTHQAIWDVNEAAAGVYFYKITIKDGNHNHQVMKQVVLIK